MIYVVVCWGLVLEVILEYWNTIHSHNFLTHLLVLSISTASLTMMVKYHTDCMSEYKNPL